MRTRWCGRAVAVVALLCVRCTAHGVEPAAAPASGDPPVTTSEYVRTGQYTPGPVGSIDPGSGLVRCGPEGTGRIIPLVGAGVWAESQNRGEEVRLDPNRIVFAAAPKGCFNSSAAIHEKGCDVKVHGTDIEVTSRFCIGMRNVSSATAGCAPPLTTCPAPPLEPGEYTVWVGHLAFQLVVPGTYLVGYMPGTRAPRPAPQ